MCCTFTGLNIFFTYDLNRKNIKTHHMFKKSYLKKTCMYKNTQKGQQLNVSSTQTQILTLNYKERCKYGGVKGTVFASETGRGIQNDKVP